jgi:hypothetical protein
LSEKYRDGRFDGIARASAVAVVVALKNLWIAACDSFVRLGFLPLRFDGKIVEILMSLECGDNAS